jgi:hypothetical protein
MDQYTNAQSGCGSDLKLANSLNKNIKSVKKSIFKTINSVATDLNVKRRDRRYSWMMLIIIYSKGK